VFPTSMTKIMRNSLPCIAARKDSIVAHGPGKLPYGSHCEQICPN
jgi:hypothetical protein